ncbi:MAG: Rieske (2Fe-2S) protein [Planctomycetes bacterium]|nr:Rieske (2Fe-2S) protein [Planctomycetota bacterium]
MSSSGERTMTRRDALAWFGRAAAVGWTLAGSCVFAEEKADKSRPPKLADLSALANESAKAMDDPCVLLVRTAKGVAALSRTCTHKHQELDVDAKSGAIYCPLHGSRFSLEGKPTNGPASRPLKWYKVEVEDGGAVCVDVKTAVDAGAWAPLPDWAKPKPKP